MEILKLRNNMTLEAFITAFANILDDTDPAEINAGTYFQELDEWSSLSNLSVIALVKTEYNKSITVKEIRACETVEDLYHYLEDAE